MATTKKQAKLTKIEKFYISNNADVDIEQLAKDLGRKVDKELKDFLEAAKVVLPTTKVNPTKNDPYVFTPPNKVEEDAFHRILPPPTDGIVRHAVKK